MRKKLLSLYGLKWNPTVRATRLLSADSGSVGTWLAGVPIRGVPTAISAAIWLVEGLQLMVEKARQQQVLWILNTLPKIEEGHNVVHAVTLLQDKSAATFVRSRYAIHLGGIPAVLSDCYYPLGPEREPE